MFGKTDDGFDNLEEMRAWQKRVSAEYEKQLIVNLRSSLLAAYEQKGWSPYNASITVFRKLQDPTDAKQLAIGFDGFRSQTLQRMKNDGMGDADVEREFDIAFAANPEEFLDAARLWGEPRIDES